jgi:starch synthase
VAARDPGLRVAILSAEVSPWAQTGGLGNVVGALPRALREASADTATVGVFLPFYRSIREVAHKLGRPIEITGLEVKLQLGSFPVHSRLLRWSCPSGAHHYFVDAPVLFDRAGGIYSHSDNAARFAYFCRAALEYAPHVLGGPPHVVHGHDWTTGGLPLLVGGPYRQKLPRTRVVLTIHNLAHQGWFPLHEMQMFGIPWIHDAYRKDQVVNFFQGGLTLADAVTTVSPNYAREIRTPDHGFGLDGLLRNREVHGILNGIDTDEWNAATDPHLPEHFDREDLRGKAGCKRALRRELGLRQTDDALVGVVSRLDPQKGLDLLADVAESFEELGLQLAVLGSGDPALAGRYASLARRHPGRIALHFGYDVGLSHRIMAGSDATLMPSRFEPCGLTQMYAMRYGTIPIVHPVGGLDDTVDDPGDEALLRGEGTGIRFFPLNRHTLSIGVRRFVGLRRHDGRGLLRLRRNMMERDWSWTTSARKYLGLFHELALS